MQFMVLQLCVAFYQLDFTSPGSVGIVAYSLAGVGMVGHICWCWSLSNSFSFSICSLCGEVISFR